MIKHCKSCGKFLPKAPKLHICRYQALREHCSSWEVACLSEKKSLHEPSVAQQKHYTQFKIQPIEFIVANGLNYNQGNVVKYVCRFKDKDGLKDLEKAKVYIGYLIQEFKTGEVKP